MFTVFSCPKAFTGRFAIIQRNAMRSWKALPSGWHALVVGDDPGTDSAALELGLDHVAEVERNAEGTPLVSAIFAAARQHAATEDEYLCYVNADIILLPDFPPAVERGISLAGKGFLFGRRTDLEVTRDLDLADGWDDVLRANAHAHGRLRQPSAMDYFVFPREAFVDMPPFAVGRPGWDQWLAYEAHRIGLTRIDLTASALVIHQSHDYSHHPAQGSGVWHGAEARRNADLMGGSLGGYSRAHTIRDAEYLLTSKGLVRNRNLIARSYRWLVGVAESSPLARRFLLWPLLKLRRVARGGWSEASALGRSRSE